MKSTRQLGGAASLTAITATLADAAPQTVVSQAVAFACAISCRVLVAVLLANVGI